MLVIVELLNTAQDVLKNSANMQAMMNEAADLAQEVMKLKADHAKELDERDMKHATEVSKLTDQIKNLTDSLAKVTDTSNRQQEKLSKAVELAEETLATHLDEINAIHDHVLGNFNPFPFNLDCWKFLPTCV